MSSDNVLIIISKAGTQVGQGGNVVVMEAGLRAIAAMATTPYIKYREDTKDLVWEGPLEAYHEYFHKAEVEQQARAVINRAMRKFK